MHGLKTGQRAAERLIMAMMLAVTVCTGWTVQALADASLYARASELYESEQYKEAVSLLKDAIRTDPDRSEYHHLLGKCHGRLAEKSVFLKAMTYARKTLKSLETAVELDNTNRAAIEDLISYYRQAPGFLGGSDRKADHWQAMLKSLKDDNHPGSVTGPTSQP